MAYEREDFEALLREHHPRIIGLCASLLGEASAAQDAAQEVFLKAYRALDRFEGKSSPETWLYRIAVNHCLDLKRKSARRKTESLDALLEKEGEAIGRLFSASGPEAAVLEAADLADRLLSQLPPEQRAALTLKEMGGLSYPEIARVLECSVESVRARLRRARRSLEEKLRHFSGPGGV